eukprot:TRINITY_DN89068_c0_g1_i1.p1 TRINITY_DN89068_c0_g1~~TRINITY_DN89068_c0_g1_i1.p1  ORF type:complete len:141 (-),score=4.96 TRINITY_DN89068_c0_g1_i1:101-493(-)
MSVVMPGALTAIPNPAHTSGPIDEGRLRTLSAIEGLRARRQMDNLENMRMAESLTYYQDRIDYMDTLFNKTRLPKARNLSPLRSMTPPRAVTPPLPPFPGLMPPTPSMYPAMLPGATYEELCIRTTRGLP